MKNVIVSEDVIRFLSKKKGKPNLVIVIYRGIRNISYGYGREFVFIPKLKVLDRKKIDSNYFIIYDSSHAIPVWVEKGVLSLLENRPITITLKKGFIKGLKLETGYEILAKR
jgi:hypothetical protein